jgi:hypothetical protein
VTPVRGPVIVRKRLQVRAASNQNLFQDIGLVLYDDLKKLLYLSYEYSQLWYHAHVGVRGTEIHGNNSFRISLIYTQESTRCQHRTWL